VLVRWLDWRWLLGACALLLGYWLILLGFSLPGMAFDKFGNAGTRLDLFLLGPGISTRKTAASIPKACWARCPPSSMCWPAIWPGWPFSAATIWRDCCAG
jgi:alpha-N-acetylglucosaminidase